MYFSKHNEKIIYINHYSGLLEVEGEGVLIKEDAEVWPTTGRNWQPHSCFLVFLVGIGSRIWNKKRRTIRTS
jgi:hypothetical protein